MRKLVFARQIMNCPTKCASICLYPENLLHTGSPAFPNFVSMMETGEFRSLLLQTMRRLLQV